MTTTVTRTGSTWLRWKGLPALSAATSIGLNIWHAVETSGYGSAVLASVAPLYLFWIIHNLVTEPGGTRGWRKDKIGVGAAGVVAIGAFAISYVTQRDLVLLLGMEEFVANILPLIVDLTIAVASYKLVHEAEATAVRDAPAAEHSTQLAMQVAAPELEYPAGLTWLAAPQARVTVTEHAAEQVTGPAPTAVQADPQPAVHRPAEPTGQAVTSDDADTAPLPVQAEQHPDLEPDPRPAQDTEQVAPIVTDSAEQPGPTPPRFEVHRGGKAPDPRPAERTVTRDPDDTGAHRELAERLVADGRTAATVEQVTRVLEMTAEGASQRTIAAEVGISSTAVGRIQTAARQLAEASA